METWQAWYSILFNFLIAIACDQELLNQTIPRIINHSLQVLIMLFFVLVFAFNVQSYGIRLFTRMVQMRRL